jgi:hypothetical protein
MLHQLKHNLGMAEEGKRGKQPLYGRTAGSQECFIQRNNRKKSMSKLTKSRYEGKNMHIDAGIQDVFC